MKENVGFSNFSQRRASYLLINADLVTFTEEILNGKLHFLSNGCTFHFRKQPDVNQFFS